LERIARRIATLFLLFLAGSYAASFAPGFSTFLWKGAALAVVVFPPLFYHFSDPEKFYFQLSKRD